MKNHPNLRSAISAINKHGVLLVFPHNNKPEPLSLWRYFYPRSRMNWEWSDKGDNRVPIIWHLREALSRSGKVVYTKWFQGRATFVSFDLFTALLSHVVALHDPRIGLNPAALNILKALEEDSPLATRELRMYSDLSGKENESQFNKGIKELWNRLLIVGYGEKEEGGFPSLAVGATRLIFEELWDNACTLQVSKRDNIIETFLPKLSIWHKRYVKFQKSLLISTQIEAGAGHL